MVRRELRRAGEDAEAGCGEAENDHRDEDCGRETAAGGDAPESESDRGGVERGGDGSQQPEDRGLHRRAVAYVQAVEIRDRERRDEGSERHRDSGDPQRERIERAASRRAREGNPGEAGDERGGNGKREGPFHSGRREQRHEAEKNRSGGQQPGCDPPGRSPGDFTNRQEERGHRGGR